MTTLAVDKDYVERLQTWLVEEAKKFARRPGESGVNAYARHSSAALSRYGLDGFAPAQISRWHKGDLRNGLEEKTLVRIGLLKGLSNDPDTAGTMAYLWLNGQSLPERSEGPAPAPESPAISSDSQTHPLLGQIRQESDPAVLKECISLAVDRLYELANFEDQDMNQSSQPPLTNLLVGWMATNKKSEADLAKLVGCTDERIKEIISGGSPLTMAECEVVSRLVNLRVDTLVAWGNCKVS